MTHVLSVHLPVVAIAEDVRVRSRFCGRLGVQSSVNSIYFETEPSCRNNATALNMNSFVVLSAFIFCCHFNPARHTDGSCKDAIWKIYSRLNFMSLEIASRWTRGTSARNTFPSSSPLYVSPGVSNEDWNFKLHINLLAEFVTRTVFLGSHSRMEYAMKTFPNFDWIKINRTQGEMKSRFVSWIHEFLSDENISFLVKHVIKTEIRLNEFIYWDFIFF